MHPTLLANVVNYTTIITADNSELKLKPGMTANISVITSDVSNVMKIPAQAITFKPDSLVTSNYVVKSPNDQKKQVNDKRSSANHETSNDEATVWILAVDQSISIKKIKTGISSDNDLQVISGLTVNDDVITGYKNP